MSDGGTAVVEAAGIAARLEAAVERLQPAQLAFLHDLVAAESETGREGAAQEVAAAAFRRAGLETAVWEPTPDELAPFRDDVTLERDYAGRPNVIGIRRGRGGGRSLILNAHVDTVEIGDRERWTRHPLGEEVGDQFYGRGACDMKGGLAANLFALLALAEAGLVPRGDVIAQSTISEEDGGAGALAAVLRGPRADGAIISEPTRRAIVPAQGGAMMFRLRVPGRSAHAATRDEGVSAIELWATVHRGLLAFEARRNAALAHPLYAHLANKVPINVGTLRAGSWPSSVPEWVVAEGRAGLLPGETIAGFKDAFAAEVGRIAAADPWLSGHPPAVEWLGGQFAPAEVPLPSPLVDALAAAHRAVAGEAPAIEGVPYGADMRHFIGVGGMPCVMYGAGDVRLAHAPDEAISLADLAGATATLAVAIAIWCGVEPAA